MSSFDLLEHIPRQSIDYSCGKIRYPFIELMSEIFRVLKPNGIFYSLTPAYPSKEAFQDPTHVNFITDDTHSYFCGENSILSSYKFNGHFEKIESKRVFPEEIYGNTKPSLKIKKLRYKLIGKKMTHLLWILKAVKNYD